MLVTKRQVKVMLLIIGLLAVGLGNYAVFQFQEAEADHSSISCVVKIDRIFHRARVILSMGFTGGEGSSFTTCVECSGGQPKMHKTKEYEMEIDCEDHYKHRWPWSSSWSDCHIHYYRATTRVDLPVPCGG